MSSNNVDNRVVNMTFNNEQFEAGVKQTLSTLEELKESLKFNNATTGISALSNAISNFQISNISDQISVLTDRFSTLGIVGMTAIENITNKVMNFTTSKISSTLGQITSGGWNRASSIAQSKFTLEGMLGDASKVEQAFDSASKAVDGTAYSLDEAASAASQLATSGIDVGQDMEDTLTSIAGVAATTGASFSDISNIFVDVASAGRMTGDALTRLSYRGVNAKQILAESLNTTSDEIQSMVSKGEVSFEQFSDAMQEHFGEHAKDANKTFSGQMSNIKSALSRIGALFATGIIENDDLINALDTVRLAINSIKKELEPLEPVFKDLVSSVSRLVVSLVEKLDFSKLETFVNIIGTGMEYVTDLANKWSGFNQTLKDSLLGKVAEDAEAVGDAVTATTEQIKKAWDIWNYAKYDVGEARKEALGDDYNRVQYLVNQIAAGVTDLENVDVSAADATEEAVDGVTDAVKETEEEAKKTVETFYPLKDVLDVARFSAKGMDVIFDNIKTTVGKIGSAFRKVFSWKDLINDVADYASTFSQFMTHFELTKDRAEKLENAISGVFSVIDILRRGIKFLITSGLKILGPILEVLFDVFLNVSSAIGDVITKFNLWEKKNSLLTSAVDWLGETVSKVTGTIKEFFKRLWNLPAVQQIKDNLGELASLIIDKLSPYFEIAAENIKKFFDKFGEADENGTMTTVLDRINEALEKLIGFAGDAEGAVGGFISYITGGISDLLGFNEETKQAEENLSGIKNAGEELVKSDSIGGFFSNIETLVSKLGGNVGSVIDWIIEKFNSIDGATAALVGFGSGITALGLSMSYLSFNLGTFFKTLSSVPKEIASTIKSFKNIFDGIKVYLQNKSQAEVIKSFAIAIAVLAASLFVLTNFTDTDKLIKVTGCMALLLAIMTAAVVVISKTSKKMMSNKNFFKSMAMISVMFISMAAAALILANALKVLTDIKWDKSVIAPIIALIATIGILIGLSVVFSKLGSGFSSGAVNVLLLSTAVYLVAISLSKISKLDFTGIEDKLKSLIIIMVTLGTVGFLISHMSFTASIGILSLIASIYLIELALYAILYLGISMDDIKSHMDRFLPVLIALGIIAAYMIVVGTVCNGANNASIKLVGMAVAIYILVKAMQLVTTLDMGHYLVAWFTIKSLLASMVVALKVLSTESNSINKAGQNLIKLAIAVGILTGIVVLVGRIDGQILSTGLWVVGTLMAMLLAFTLLTSLVDNNIDFRSLYAIVVAIGVMTVATVLLSRIQDKFALWEAAGIMALMIMSFGASLYLACRWANKLQTSALVVMLGTLIVVAASLYVLTKYTNNSTRMAVAAASMAAVMIALGYTFKIITQSFNSLNEKDFTKRGRMYALLAMIGLLALVAAALILLSKQSIGGIAAATIAILLTLYGVVQIMTKFLNSLANMKIDKEPIIALAVMIGLIAGIAVSLSVLALACKEAGILNMLGAVLALSGVLVVVVFLLQYINQEGKTFSAGAIGSIIASIALLAAATAALYILLSTGASPEEMLSAATSLALVFGVVAIIMGLLISIVSSSGGVGIVAALVVLAGMSAVLLSLAAAFLAFGKASKSVVAALTQLTKVDFKVLKENMGTLWAMVAIAAALSVISLVLGAGLIGVGAGLTLVGVGAVLVAAAVSLMAVSFTLVVKAITALVVAFNDLLTTFASSKGAISSGISEIGTGLANGITNFVSTLALQAPIIKASVLAIIVTITSLITEGINSFISIVIDGIVTFLNKLDENLPEITERVNSIITTLLQSIAENASTFGYYGAVIAISFLYGLSEGLVEYSDELGETIANLITAVFTSIKSLIAELMPTIGEILEGGILDIREAIWGLLAETGWEGAEEQYQMVLQDQQEFAEKTGEKSGVAANHSFGVGLNKSKQEVVDAAENVAEEATDKSQEVYEEGGDKNGSAFLDGTTDSIGDGWSGVKNFIKEKIGSDFSFDMSGSGESAGLTFMNGLQSSTENQTMDVSHLPTEAIEQLKDEGWTLEAGGKTMVKSIQSGVDDSSLDFSSLWSDSETELYNEADDTSAGMTEKGNDAGSNYGDGVISGLQSKQDEINAAFADSASQADEAFKSKDGLDEHSPSKKGYSAGAFYSIGVGNGVSDLAGYVKKAAVNLAQSAVTSVAEMMGKIDTIMNDEDINWQPTFTPVIDSSQIQNGINYLGNINAESVGLATDASISVNNSQQASLASQVQALSDQVQRLADTDYSKMLEGVNINVDASTNVDGTPLRRMSSAYTIQQINDTQNGLIMAAGGRV